MFARIDIEWQSGFNKSPNGTALLTGTVSILDGENLNNLTPKKNCPFPIEVDKHSVRIKAESWELPVMLEQQHDAIVHMARTYWAGRFEQKTVTWWLTT